MWLRIEKLGICLQKLSPPPLCLGANPEWETNWKLELSFSSSHAGWAWCQEAQECSIKVNWMKQDEWRSDSRRQTNETQWVVLSQIICYKREKTFSLFFLSSSTAPECSLPWFGCLSLIPNPIVADFHSRVSPWMTNAPFLGWTKTSDAQCF